MKINTILPHNEHNNCIKHPVFTHKNKTNVPNYADLIISDSPYGKAILQMYETAKLKQETSQFPKDIEYRKQLMINAGLNPLNQHKLRAIAGPQEIKSIMKAFDKTPEVFSVGENNKNIINHTMRANLHMHTTASDGGLTIEELLNNAAHYANKVKNSNPKTKTPFVVAITDHDTTESAQEAIRIIADNPFKYKNLRVILGTEITTFNNIAQDLVSTPTNTHVLVYGIDPNEKGFKDFIDTTKAKKQQIQEIMTKTANETYKKNFGKDNFFNVLQAKQEYNPLNKNIIGIYNGMEAYYLNKFSLDEIILKNKKMTKKLEKRNLPTTTEKLMDKLIEFHAATDRNNRVKKPYQTIPEFLAICAEIDEDTTIKTLDNGFKKAKNKKFIEELKENISEYKITTAPKYKYIPDFAGVYNGLKSQKDAIIGIAHPIDTIKNLNDENKYKFLSELYSDFKKNCKEKAKFTEAYYQSYKPERKAFNELPKTQEFFVKIGKTFKLLRTGSADTHGLNIFMR